MCTRGGRVRLYDTFGFPFELTVEIAGERGLTVDQSGFDTRPMEAQRERARAARGGNAIWTRLRRGTLPPAGERRPPVRGL